MVDQLDITKLKGMFEREQWDAAKRVLEEYLNSELTQDEKAIIYTVFVTTFLRVMARINLNHQAILDDMLRSLRLVERAKKKISKK